ncbi:demethoxyubiquinone hydroxylase family protein [Aestuariivirga sp.]|uniref:demethoxyubiquinone hydroxylase family protein n=1 Tax=Aestuariivirga sp. TaxID=2650926 RepID=UPI0039E33EB7
MIERKATLMPDARERRIIARILKVNHAGEHGAIRIYATQRAISSILNPGITAKLDEMYGHEIEHHRLFLEAMPSRSARPCRMLFLWAWGGGVLGILTALCGKRAVWLCTEAVEHAVHHHLDDQLLYLADKDEELERLIASIQAEEASHLAYAKQNSGNPSLLSRLLLRGIGSLTTILIWMSTSGDSVRLKRELAANHASHEGD